MGRNIRITAIAILAILGGIYFYNKYKVAPKMDLSKLPLTDLNGNVFKVDSLKGKKLIVSFGASWCPNCIDELNTLKTIRNTDLSDVEIVVISDEPEEVIMSFKGRKEYPFRFLKLNQPFNAIGINSIPTTYIFNTKMDVKDETVGYVDWSDPSTLEHLKKLME